ncbi:MAG: hypothetical protein K2J81_00360 [Treponemataceae bacterium]|nr:hypothetical protein [Treponemataceae bacterium]
MKLTKLIALAVAAACVLPVGAATKARKMSAPKSNWNVYLPGKGNKKDAAKDLEKQGWLTGDNAAKHFSLVDGDVNGKRLLKFDTSDSLQDAMVFPLSGDEKKVTLIFKARGAVDPDNAATPLSIFYAYWEKGIDQSVLRHNSSNQIKGSNNMSRLREGGTAQGKPLDIVSDWHDFRLVFDSPDGAGGSMTAKVYIDGVLYHEDTNKPRPEYTIDLNFDPANVALPYMTGKGNYLEFGDNDGSSNAYGLYAYFLLVIDEDVSGMSLAELGQRVKADLVTNPQTNDKGPASRRPAQKPAGINMQGPEVNSSDPVYYDPATISGGKLRLNKMPYSRADTEVITAAPALPDLAFAATVDATGANGAYKTIAQAVAAVPEGSAIKIMPGLYYEKLVITKNGISLVGTDPATTIIYGYEADTGSIDGNLLVEVNLLPRGTNTEPGETAPVPEQPAAHAYFNAANLTFYNKGAEWNHEWGGAERRSIALALKGVDTSYLKNCIFLGQQDTLYFRSGRVYAENCYVEGDVDYICGGATVLFDRCKINTIQYLNGGIIVAAAGADTGYASTAPYANGFVFRDCKITGHKSFEAADKKVTLARGTWTGGSATGGTVTGKTVFIRCDIQNIVTKEVWANWDNTNTAAKCFFRAYQCTGAGASAVRPQMTDAEYNASYASTEKILGFTPVMR